MRSELSRLLNITSEKATLFIAAKPYKSPTDAFCSRSLKDELGKSKKLSLRITSSLMDSDAVIVPFDLGYWYKNKDYVNYLKSLARHKKLIILNTTDFLTKTIQINNAIFLRPFLNPGEFAKNTIIIPYEIEPLLGARTQNPKFIVSFMGYVPRISPTRIFYSIKNSFKNPILGNGSIIRWVMILKIRKAKFTINIVPRNKFSGWKRDNSESTLQNRAEYIKSIEESRYILCPRGDGNQSIRFYETLSAGRVPIIIDSRMVFPLSQSVDLSKFIIILKVNESIATWNEKILEFESSLSDHDFKILSQEICNMYDKYFSYYNFYKNLFVNFIV